MMLFIKHLMCLICLNPKPQGEDLHTSVSGLHNADGPVFMSVGTGVLCLLFKKYAA